jgi:Uri superfamily endonuclease
VSVVHNQKTHWHINWLVQTMDNFDTENFIRIVSAD